MKDNIRNRMKFYYEDSNRTYLTRHIPVILRLDGKSFRTLTRKMNYKKFDIYFGSDIASVSEFLLKEIQGAKCVYSQSDEISLLLIDYDTVKTDAWFDYNIQKMVSISASMASVEFSHISNFFNRSKFHRAYFAARVFNIPREDVNNYFIWRQLDCIRNSILTLGQLHFSHKELQGKNQKDIHEMLYKKGINWATDIDSMFRNGVFQWKNEYGDLSREQNFIFTKDKEKYIINSLIKGEKSWHKQNVV
jgi:tRNA(His) guanylyltransferase